VVGDGTTRRSGAVSGETCAGSGERRRSQSLHGTEAVKAVRSAESKAAPRDGRQEGGGVNFTGKQGESQAPAVPARATQGAETHDRDWSWVQASVWTERMLAALENGVRGGKWFSLIDKVYRCETLKAAWKKVEANAGGAGVDGQSVERFAVRAEMYLEELSTALKTGTYRPQPIKRVEIPKAGGRFRPLGIPVVKDRIVQTALKFVLEPIFEREFLKTSYGFRPGVGSKEALREVDRLLKDGYPFVVDADLRSYFDTIPHAQLMERVEEKVSDGRVVELIEAFLKQDIMKEMERWTPIGGTPQGAVISPLLANIYLHPLDCHMQQKGYCMIRYADDFIVLCPTADKAQAALEEVRSWVEQNGLSLNVDKTHVGDCRQEGQGFEFLGYRFEAGRRWVRKSSMRAFRDHIRMRTKRTRGDSLATIIADLNPKLRGWFHYFKHAHRMTFSGMDGLVRRRLRAILRKQEKRPGRGRCPNDHRRWPNTFFAAQGLFTMVTAWQLASQSR
jgi:RNA-directed DNA polymerase